MHRMQMQEFVMIPSNSRRFVVVLTWAVGLILGIVFAYSTDTLVSLMPGILDIPVSIVGLAAVNWLPFLFTAAAVFVSRPGLVLVPVFCKAFSFGACAATFDIAFYSASWLMRLIVLFSDLLSLPLLFWLWLSCVSGERRTTLRRFGICGILLIIITAADLWFITPLSALI